MVAFRAHCITSPLSLSGSAGSVLVMITSLSGARVPQGPRGDFSARWGGGCWLQLLEWRRCNLSGPLFPALGREGAKSKQSFSLLPCHFVYLTASDRPAAQRQRRNPGRRATWRSRGVLSRWSCPPALPSPGEPGEAYTVSWRRAGCPVSAPDQAF